MKHTFTAMTYNLWGKFELEARTPAIAELIEKRAPDLLGVQELEPETRDAIDKALPYHERVEDEFQGWSKRGNLWWDAREFEYVTHGYVDVGIIAEYSRLFWVRLKSLTNQDAPEIIFATTHFSAPGTKQETETRVTPRIEQGERVTAALNELAGEEEIALLCVDINDYAYATWEMYEGGFFEPFGYLGRTAPVTHPSFPRHPKPRKWEPTEVVQKTIDWVYFRGPVQPRAAEVVEYFYNGYAPSDHKPVIATFSI